MKRWMKGLAALFVLAASLCAQQANVTISDTVYMPDGVTPFTGALTIYWPGFALGGKNIPEGSQAVFATSGVFSVNLWPSDQAMVTSRDSGQTIRGFVYRVTAYTTKGPLIQFWLVPSSAQNTTITLASISPQHIITPSTIGNFPANPPVNTLRIATDATNGGDCTTGLSTSASLCRWTGSVWLAVTSVGGGSSAWGGITGTLSSQTDLQNALNAKLGTGSILTPINCSSQFPTGIDPTTGNATGCSSVDYAQIAPDVLQYATVNITAAQFKNCFTTPIVLVAAPGAGKMIELVSAVFEVTAVTTGYTIGGSLRVAYGTNGALRYQSASTGDPNFANLQNILSAGISDIAPLFGLQFGNFLNSGPGAFVNQALNFYSSVSNPTTGDATIMVKLVYRVHSGL